MAAGAVAATRRRRRPRSGNEICDDNDDDYCDEVVDADAPGPADPPSTFASNPSGPGTQMQSGSTGAAPSSTLSRAVVLVAVTALGAAML